VVVGDTGSGKSVLVEGGMVTNVAATDGPDILFDYKGGGTAEEYLRMHYAEYGDLDDVLYFDLSRVPRVLVFRHRTAAGRGHPEGRSPLTEGGSLRGRSSRA